MPQTKKLQLILTLQKFTPEFLRWFKTKVTETIKGHSNLFLKFREFIFLILKTISLLHITFFKEDDNYYIHTEVLKSKTNDKRSNARISTRRQTTERVER